MKITQAEALEWARHRHHITEEGPISDRRYVLVTQDRCVPPAWGHCGVAWDAPANSDYGAVLEEATKLQAETALALMGYDPFSSDWPSIPDHGTLEERVNGALNGARR